MYLKSGPTNPPAWLDLSNTACSLLVTVFILSLKRLPIQVFYAGTWEIIAVWDSRSPKSQLVWVTAHKQELLNCWSNYQEPGQISTGECDTWNSLQKMTVGTKSWPKFKRKPTNFMKEKSISRWEIAPYQNSKAWKTLGQVSPKDVPVYHTPYGFICWLINWLMVLRKLSCHSSLWPLLCEGLVQGHSLSPGAASILPTQEQPGVAHWATCTKCIPHQWTGCRLPATWVWPWMYKDHLDQVCFFVLTHMCTHKMWSVHHSCSFCTYDSFLRFLKTKEDPCKTKSGMDICKHPKLLTEDKDCGKASHITTQVWLEIRGKPHLHIAK